MKSHAAAAISIALALVSFFQFPGHTWLQQDTQIYAPILENQRDPAVLRNDPLVQHPHVAYTLYDEVTRAFRGLTGLGFREVLMLEQIVARAFGIWGLYLMAEALGLSAAPAWLVAMIVSLGARVPGPELLTVEYEPTPRAIALPLVICAIGLTAHRRYLAAGIAGACAFLFHPPTALPFWALFAIPVAIAPRKTAIAVAPFAIAVAVLFVAQGGEPQDFFARITPLQEQLQRMRTAYVWISLWPGATVWRYVLLAGIVAAAASRVRETGSGVLIFAAGLPILGLLSMPISWLLLERAKLAIAPELQPMRAVLFIVLMAQFLSAAAGATAMQKGRRGEAACWFAVALGLALPIPLTVRPAAAAIGLAALMALASRWSPAVALAAFFAIPWVGGVINYPRLHTPQLTALSEWARSSTPRDAVFVFPDAGHNLAPGIFRSDALRAVYVDWKSGGQVNYLPDFAQQWQFRWQQTIARGFAPADLSRYDALGIQYVVLRPENRLAREAQFENQAYVVYETGK